MSGLSHVDAGGRATMVDVSDKPATARTATARGELTCLPETLAAVADGTAPKGAVLHTAELAGIMPSPIVELNRAVAIAMDQGPAAGLELVDRLISDNQLAGYHLLWSVRGDFLFKLARFTEARVEFLRAAELTQNARERELMERRAAECTAS